MSLATFVRAALVLGSFAAIAPVAGCTAQVGDGHEDVGQGQEALPCTDCGGSSSGSSSSGSSSGGTTCNPDLSCCLTGSSTLAAIDAEVALETGASTTCGQQLAALGCGASYTNPITHVTTVTVGYSTAKLPGVAMASPGYWYEMVCPVAAIPQGCEVDDPTVCFPYYPSGCVQADFPTGGGASAAAPHCQTTAPAGYIRLDIDPNGCSGSTCVRTNGSGGTM